LKDEQKEAIKKAVKTFLKNNPHPSEDELAEFSRNRMYTIKVSGKDVFVYVL